MDKSYLNFMAYDSHSRPFYRNAENAWKKLRDNKATRDTVPATFDVNEATTFLAKRDNRPDLLDNLQLSSTAGAGRRSSYEKPFDRIKAFSRLGGDTQAPQAIADKTLPILDKVFGAFKGKDETLARETCDLADRLRRAQNGETRDQDGSDLSAATIGADLEKLFKLYEKKMRNLPGLLVQTLDDAIVNIARQVNKHTLAPQPAPVTTPPTPPVQVVQQLQVAVPIQAAGPVQTAAMPPADTTNAGLTQLVADLMKKIDEQNTVIADLVRRGGAGSPPAEDPVKKAQAEAQAKETQLNERIDKALDFYDSLGKNHLAPEAIAQPIMDAANKALGMLKGEPNVDQTLTAKLIGLREHLDLVWHDGRDNTDTARRLAFDLRELIKRTRMQMDAVSSESTTWKALDGVRCEILNMADHLAAHGFKPM